jgi:hypothetical protein
MDSLFWGKKASRVMICAQRQLAGVQFALAQTAPYLIGGRDTPKIFTATYIYNWVPAVVPHGGGQTKHNLNTQSLQAVLAVAPLKKGKHNNNNLLNFTTQKV